MPKGPIFFFHTVCLHSKCSKFCREFIFVLKQQEKNFDLKEGYGRAAGPNSNPSPTPNPKPNPRANQELNVGTELVGREHQL